LEVIGRCGGDEKSRKQQK